MRNQLKLPPVPAGEEPALKCPCCGAEEIGGNDRGEDFQYQECVVYHCLAVYKRKSMGKDKSKGWDTPCSCPKPSTANVFRAALEELTPEQRMAACAVIHNQVNGIPRAWHLIEAVADALEKIDAN